VSTFPPGTGQAPAPGPAAGGTVIPQGPGVQPPFPAPPAEGRGSRIGWSLGIAGAALVLCCGGALTAFFGFGVAQVAALDEQSKVVVTSYLDAISEQKYGEAYDLLCDEQQARVSENTFAQRERGKPELSSYDLGEYDINLNQLPVTERYRDGSTDQVTYQFANDPATAQLEICGRVG
jgi:hypothetical protein